MQETSGDLIMAKAKKATEAQRSDPKFKYFLDFRNIHKVKFDDEAKAYFLSVYADTGRMTYAAECAMVSAHIVKKNIQEDPAFAAAFEEAKWMYGDKIQAEINRRGVDGIEEPIVNFRDNTIVGRVRKFSDRLLELNAKRYIPEYRDKLEIDATVQQSGVLAVTATENMSAEDWAAKFAKRKDS